MQAKRVSLILRIVGVALFALGGGCLILMSFLSAPSFWYYPCFYALPLIAPFWAWRPRVGAGLAVGPLVAVIAQLRFLSGLTLGFVLICVIVALSCMLFAVREPGAFRLPVVVSLCLLSMSFLADRLVHWQSSDQVLSGAGCARRRHTVGHSGTGMVRRPQANSSLSKSRRYILLCRLSFVGASRPLDAQPWGLSPNAD